MKSHFEKNAFDLIETNRNFALEAEKIVFKKKKN